MFTVQADTAVDESGALGLERGGIGCGRALGGEDAGGVVGPAGDGVARLEEGGGSAVADGGGVVALVAEAEVAAVDGLQATD